MARHPRSVPVLITGIIIGVFLGLALAWPSKSFQPTAERPVPDSAFRDVTLSGLEREPVPVRTPVPFPTPTLGVYLDPASPTTLPTKAPIRQTQPKAISEFKSPEPTAKPVSVSSTLSISEGRALAKAYVRERVSASQYQCFLDLWNKESGWNYRALNKSSGAYGIPQALPGSKMKSVGSDWKTNPITQVKWGMRYVDARYGSGCGAWRFWLNNSWY